jgi:hypothetical protein
VSQKDWKDCGRSSPASHYLSVKLHPRLPNGLVEIEESEAKCLYREFGAMVFFLGHGLKKIYDLPGCNRPRILGGFSFDHADDRISTGNRIDATFGVKRGRMNEVVAHRQKYFERIAAFTAAFAVSVGIEESLLFFFPQRHFDEIVRMTPPEFKGLFIHVYISAK